MNRKLTGEPLTTDDLKEIALSHGLKTEDELRAMEATYHNKNLLWSKLLDVTAKVRYQMFMHGELNLDTRTPSNTAFASRKQAVDADTAAHGVMVCFFPSPEVQELMSSWGSEPPSQIHLTLAYLGKDVDVDRDALINAVGLFAEGAPEITGIVSGSATFSSTNPEEKGGHVQVCLFDSPDIDEFRKWLVDMLEDAGLSVSKDHGYTPHITLGYLDAGEPVEWSELPVEPFSITFDSVSVEYGTERFNFPLQPNLN